MQNSDIIYVKIQLTNKIQKEQKIMKKLLLVILVAAICCAMCLGTNAGAVYSDDQWLCGDDPGANMQPNWWFNPVGEPDERYIEVYFTADGYFSGINAFYYCSNPVLYPDFVLAQMKVELLKNSTVVYETELNCIGDKWEETEFDRVYAPGEYSIRYSCIDGSGIENNCWCVLGGTTLSVSGDVFVDCNVHSTNPDAAPCIMLIGAQIPEGEYMGCLSFYNCDTYYEVSDCDSAAEGEIEIPENVQIDGVELPVQSICSWAFARCDKITGVTIPDGVSNIGWKAFVGCSSLKSVEIPDSVTSLAYGTFEGCSSLTEVSIPESVTYIDEAVFNECNGLTTVKYAGSEEKWNAVEIGRANEPLKNAKIIFNYTGVIRGDCNNDGAIDNKDVVILFRYVSGTDKLEDETAYDFNNDGAVDNKDVVALFRHVSE